MDRRLFHKGPNAVVISCQMMCLGRVGRSGGGSDHISFQRSVMAFSGSDTKSMENLS